MTHVKSADKHSAWHYHERSGTLAAATAIAFTALSSARVPSSLQVASLAFRPPLDSPRGKDLFVQVESGLPVMFTYWEEHAFPSWFCPYRGGQSRFPVVCVEKRHAGCDYYSGFINSKDGTTVNLHLPTTWFHAVLGSRPAPPEPFPCVSAQTPLRSRAMLPRLL